LKVEALKMNSLQEIVVTWHAKSFLNLEGQWESKMGWLFCMFMSPIPSLATEDERSLIKILPIRVRISEWESSIGF
jgi:hypothetical protein